MVFNAQKALAAAVKIADETGPGAASVEKSFEGVARAAEGANVAVERTVKQTSSAERAWATLQRRIDPLGNATLRLEAGFRTLDRAVAEGVIGDERRREAQRRLQAEFDRTRERVEAAERSQRGLSRSLDDVQQKLGPLGGAFGALRANIAGAAAGFVAFVGVSAGIRAVFDSLERADALDDLSKRINANVEQLQAYRFAAQQTGAEIGALDAALGKLNVNLGKGGGEADLGAVKALDALFSEAEQAKLRAGTTDQAFRNIAEKLAAIEEPARRAALAAGIFGKEAGPQLAPLLAQGAKGLAEYEARARELGLVLEADLVAKGGAAKDALEELKATFEANVTRVVLQNADDIRRLAEGLANFIPIAARAASSWLEFVGALEKAPAQKLQDVQLAIGRLTDRGAFKDGGFDGGSPTGPTLIGQGLDVVFGAERKRLAELTKLRQEQSTLLRQIGAEAGAQFAEESARRRVAATQKESEALGQLAAARDKALARENAAAAGKASLSGFDLDAKIAAEIKSAGLVGKQADEYRRVAKEIAAAEDRTSKLEKGFTAAAKAAKSVRIDPLKDIQAANDNLRALVDAAQGGREALRLEEARQARAAEIARIERDAARDKQTFTKQELADLDAALQKREALSRTLERSEAATAAREDAAREFERAFVDAGQRVWDEFARTGRLSIAGLGRSLLATLRDAAIAPLRQLTANLLSGLSGAFSGIGGVFTPGVNGANPANGAGLRGFSLGGLGSLATGLSGFALGGAAGTTFGLASLIGPGALGRFGAQAGNLLGLSGGLTGALSKTLANAGTLGGALGGIGGSLLSNLVFGRSKASSIGSSIGGIAGSFFGPIGSLVGSFLGGGIGRLIGGKPSDNAAGTRVALDTGASLGSFAKNNNAENIKTRDQIIAEAQAFANALKDLGLSFGGANLFVQAGSRDGISVESGGVTRRFAKDDAAGAAQGAGELIAKNIAGGDADLRAFVSALADAKKPLNDIIDSATRFKQVLDANAEPLTATEQRLKDLKETVGTLIDEQKALGLETQRLSDVYKNAVQKIADDINTANRKAIDQTENPRLAAIEELLKQQAADRKDAAAVTAAGGNVDAGLQADAQRRQILAQFNIADRLAQGSNAAAFQVTQFLKNQANELAALKRAVDQSGGLVTNADVVALQQAQAAELTTFFNALPDADKLKLGGLGGILDQVEVFGGRLQVVLTQINDELRKQGEVLERTLDDLRTQAATRSAERDAFDRAIAQTDRAAPGTNPENDLIRRRAEIDDLKRRALSEDEATRKLAREQLPQAVSDFLSGTESVAGRGLAFEEARQFGREALTTVRARIDTEQTAAERQIRILEESRDLQAKLVAILGEPSIDRQKLIGVAAGLDPGNALSPLLFEFLRLQQQQTDANTAATSALAVLRPVDVGLTTAPATLAPPAVTPPPETLTQTRETQAAGSSAATQTSAQATDPARAVDTADALYKIARSIGDLADDINALGQSQKTRDDTANNYLASIAAGQRRAV